MNPTAQLQEIHRLRMMPRIVKSQNEIQAMVDTLVETVLDDYLTSAPPAMVRGLKQRILDLIEDIQD